MFSKHSGSALILVITLTTILLLVAVASTMSSVSNINITAEERIKTELQLACESALNRGRAKIENSFGGSLDGLEPYLTFEGSDEDDSGFTAENKKFDDESFNAGGGSTPDYYSYVVQEDPEDKEIYVKYAIYLDPDTEADPSYNNGWLRSQAMTRYPMVIEAIAYKPGFGWVGIKEQATARRSTLFMYNIFFEDELEILPGPNFNIKGLIHTNKDMYLSSNNTLTVNTDSMTAAGEMYRRRMNNTESLGTVRISAENEDGTLQTMGRSPKEDSTNSNWVNMATNKWKGSVRDKHLGATKLESPKLESIEPGGYYDQQADFRLKVYSAGRATPVYDLSIDQVQVVSQGSLATVNSYLNGAVSEVEYYDRRESTTKKVKSTEIDLAKLGDTSHSGASAVWPSNGLFFMTRDDAVKDTDGNPYSPDPNRNVTGFKLTNGSELHDAATFVTNNPMYIKGDFNLHTSADPMSDKWNGCAVIADAINVLSNSWQDSQSSSKRTASNTTFNLVFITGNVPTNEATGQYSGGLENFPRMLENWGGKNLNINGGMMQLFRSQYATANWSYGGYYDAPNRNWYAEERFQDLDDFPPGFTSLFPSINYGVVYSGWTRIDKDEAYLVQDDV